jgi:hypothetical protein
MRLESQNLQRFVCEFTTDQIRQRPNLPGADSRVSVYCPVRHGLSLFSHQLLLATLAAVTTEGSGRSKLTEFVPNHILSHEDLDVRFTIVNHKRRTYELRHNRATSRPGRDRL